MTSPRTHSPSTHSSGEVAGGFEDGLRKIVRALRPPPTPGAALHTLKAILGFSDDFLAKALAFGVSEGIVARCGDDSQRVCLGRNARRFQASAPGTLEVPAHWRPHTGDSNSRSGLPPAPASASLFPRSRAASAAAGGAQRRSSARLRDLRSRGGGGGGAPPNSHIRFNSHSHFPTGSTHSSSPTLPTQSSASMQSDLLRNGEASSDGDSDSDSDSDSESDSDSDSEASFISTSSSVQEVTITSSSSSRFASNGALSSTAAANTAPDTPDKVALALESFDPRNSPLGASGRLASRVAAQLDRSSHGAYTPPAWQPQSSVPSGFVPPADSKTKKDSKKDSDASASFRDALYRHLWKLPETLRATLRAKAQHLDPLFVDAMVHSEPPKSVALSEVARIVSSQTRAYAASLAWMRKTFAPVDEEDNEASSAAGGGDGGDTLSELSCVLRLYDPITLTRFTHPARGARCTHRGAFELETFLKQRYKRCSICNKHIPTKRLVVDAFVGRILAETAKGARGSGSGAEVREVTLKCDGSWHAEDKSAARRSAGVEVSLISDDEDESLPLAKSVASVSRKGCDIPMPLEAPSPSLSSDVPFHKASNKSQTNTVSSSTSLRARPDPSPRDDDSSRSPPAPMPGARARGDRARRKKPPPPSPANESCSSSSDDSDTIMGAMLKRAKKRKRGGIAGEHTHSSSDDSDTLMGGMQKRHQSRRTKKRKRKRARGGADTPGHCSDRSDSETLIGAAHKELEQRMSSASSKPKKAKHASPSRESSVAQADTRSVVAGPSNGTPALKSSSTPISLPLRKPPSPLSSKRKRRRSGRFDSPSPESARRVTSSSRGDHAHFHRVFARDPPHPEEAAPRRGAYASEAPSRASSPVTTPRKRVEFVIKKRAGKRVSPAAFSGFRDPDSLALEKRHVAPPMEVEKCLASDDGSSDFESLLEAAQSKDFAQSWSCGENIDRSSSCKDTAESASTLGSAKASDPLKGDKQAAGALQRGQSLRSRSPSVASARKKRRVASPVSTSDSDERTAPPSSHSAASKRHPDDSDGSTEELSKRLRALSGKTRNSSKRQRKSSTATDSTSRSSSAPASTAAAADSSSPSESSGSGRRRSSSRGKKRRRRRRSSAGNNADAAAVLVASDRNSEVSDNSKSSSRPTPGSKARSPSPPTVASSSSRRGRKKGRRRRSTASSPSATESTPSNFAEQSDCASDRRKSKTSNSLEVGPSVATKARHKARSNSPESTVSVTPLASPLHECDEDGPLGDLTVPWALSAPFSKASGSVHPGASPKSDSRTPSLSESHVAPRCSRSPSPANLPSESESESEVIDIQCEASPKEEDLSCASRTPPLSGMHVTPPSSPESRSRPNSRARDARSKHSSDRLQYPKSKMKNSKKTESVEEEGDRLNASDNQEATPQNSTRAGDSSSSRSDSSKECGRSRLSESVEEFAESEKSAAQSTLSPLAAKLKDLVSDLAHRHESTNDGSRCSHTNTSGSDAVASQTSSSADAKPPSAYVRSSSSSSVATSPCRVSLYPNSFPSSVARSSSSSMAKRTSVAPSAFVDVIELSDDDSDSDEIQFVGERRTRMPPPSPPFARRAGGGGRGGGSADDPVVL